ncbi:MAG: potassium channel family protein [Rhodospirillales bacterium]|nr:potassium channel family protein [Rhodospirillales bacterium]
MNKRRHARHAVAARPSRPATVGGERSAWGRLRNTLDHLYNGSGRQARRFRTALLVFDVVTIAFFILASMMEFSAPILIADIIIAVLLVADFGARLWLAPSKVRFLFDIVSLADLVVIATLLAPALIQNWAFLRVLRAMRLLRSYHVLRDIRETWPFLGRNQDVIQSVLNLVIFLFVITAFVYVLQHGRNPAINNYIDALYFTVATLTTTGFGDITLVGSSGRLLAVIIMVVGVALFLRLVQTIFRPDKVRYTCPTCGLSRHETDAVHCKHCGRVLHIETEGA